MMKACGYVFYTELLLQLRRSHAWLYSIGFFLIVMSLFPLAFSPDPLFLQKYTPGCIWIAALLASLLSLENLFHADLEDAHLEQLRLCQTSFTLIILAKLGAQWVVSELPLILLTPLLGWLFHLTNTTVLTLCVGLLLGTPMLTLIGSLGVALTLGLRQQGALLGLLILPLLTPVIIFGVNIVQESAAGMPITGPLLFLAGVCLFTITLLPWTIAAAIKIGVDD